MLTHVYNVLYLQASGYSGNRGGCSCGRVLHGLPCSTLLKDTEQHEEIIGAANRICYLFVSNFCFFLSFWFT